MPGLFWQRLQQCDLKNALRKGQHLSVHTYTRPLPSTVELWIARKQASGEFPPLAPLSTALTPTPELVRASPRAGTGGPLPPPWGPAPAVPGAGPVDPVVSARIGRAVGTYLLIIMVIIRLINHERIYELAPKS